MTITEQLKQIVSEHDVIEQADMARHTSFRAGGTADLLVMPQDIEALKAVLGLLEQEHYPHMILGNGSNILVKDSGYHGAIVKLGEAFHSVRQDGSRLICGAAALMSAVSNAAVCGSLSGFEFASGIPGSIGGAVFMNAGAYGGELVQVLERVRLISPDGSRDFYRTAEELDMGYRHSLLQESGDVAVEVVLNLEPGKQEEIRAKISELTARRNEKQPVSYPSAGSFFKRPTGYFAGTLIQDAGLKGLSVGGAQVSELHAGFIINTGGATATDILQLMEIVQETVFDQFGVRLEPEVRIIGD